MTKQHLGSCHCGAIRFSVELDATKGSRCNCSVCTKINQLGAIVAPAAFELLAGSDARGTYVCGPIGRRYFCRTCGVHCYSEGHLDVLGGDYVSINLQCLDDLDPREVAVTYWDGRHDNWQAGPATTPWPIRNTPHRQLD
jgi:hypothetical protein